MYGQVLEQHPDNVRALNDLAWILQEHDRRYDAALELANKGLALAPEDTHLLDTRGTILSKMPDRLPDARKDYEKIVPLQSSDARQQAAALFQLGRICAKLDDFVPARQHLQKALEIDRKVSVFTADERVEITKIVQQVGN
jgi:tetratricopeptide (TPR) repeat protein